MAKNSPNTNVFWPKIGFLDSPGRDLSNQGRGFPFGAIPGTDIFGDPHHPILIKIPTSILAFPNPWQAAMPPSGQIRSQTSGFMWSLLCKAPQLSQNPNFPVFQEVQVRPKSLRGFFLPEFFFILVLPVWSAYDLAGAGPAWPWPALICV